MESIQLLKAESKLNKIEAHCILQTTQLYLIQPDEPWECAVLSLTVEGLPATTAKAVAQVFTGGMLPFWLLVRTGDVTRGRDEGRDEMR